MTNPQLISFRLCRSGVLHLFEVRLETPPVFVGGGTLRTKTRDGEPNPPSTEPVLILTLGGALGALGALGVMGY